MADDLDDIKKKLMAILRREYDRLRAMASKGVRTLENAARKIQPFFEKLAKAASKIMKFLPGKIVKTVLPVVKALAGASRTIAQHIQKCTGTVLRLMKDIVKANVKRLKKIVTKVVANVLKAARQLVDALLTLKKLLPSVSQIAAKVKQGGRMLAMVFPAAKMADAIGKSVKELKTIVAQMLREVTQTVKSLKGLPKMAASVPA